MLLTSALKRRLADIFWENIHPYENRKRKLSNLIEIARHTGLVTVSIFISFDRDSPIDWGYQLYSDPTIIKTLVEISIP